MKTAIGLAAAAVLAQIAYPLTDPGPGRDRLTVLTVVLFCTASVTAALVARGPRFTALLLALTAGGGFLAEAIGTATGIPFGSYDYADRLGLRLLDVPLVVPLAWTMMGYPAWVAARRLTTSKWRPLVAGWALASWDLFLDPQLVDAGHWRWTDVELALPGVPDIPVSNYLGWLLVATAMMVALDRWADMVIDQPDADDRVPVALYLWTFASSVLAHAALLDLGWSAVYGGLAMGLVAVPLALRVVPRTRRAVGAAAVALAGAGLAAVLVPEPTAEAGLLRRDDPPHFFALTEDGRDIGLFDRRGGLVRVVVNSGYDGELDCCFPFEDLAVSDDGRWLLYVDGIGGEGMHRVPTGGGPAESLGIGRDPHLSPDGRRLAYAAHPPGAPSSCGQCRRDLVVRDLTTGAEKRFLGQYDVHLFDLTWSPDGTRIAAARDRGIVVVDLSGPTELRRHRVLRPAAAADVATYSSPQWLSDTRIVAAEGRSAPDGSGFRTTTSEVVELDAGTGRVVRRHLRLEPRYGVGLDLNAARTRMLVTSNGLRTWRVGTQSLTGPRLAVTSWGTW